MKLQDKQKLISDMSGAPSSFVMKLKLFRKLLENINLSCYSSCDLLRKNASASLPLPVSVL
jgi:hypothetical protein